MAKIHLEETIPTELAGARLDQALAKLFPQYSRSQLATWIRAGEVQVDQHIWQRPRDKVCAEQQIIIDAQPPLEERWVAQAIELNIVHEDDDILIINKPVGLVVHPGAGNPDQTLVNALLHYDAKLAMVPRAGIVHRLDKETSGLLIIARNLVAHHKLVKMLQQRQIHREYEAIVHGEMVAGGTIEAPIGRHPSARTKMSVVSSGKEARTHYRIIERFPKHTHLRVQLETGRTHQIRVHLAHINYPIVGDPTYGRRGRNHHLLIKRQALHAAKLEFNHPISDKPLEFRAPLPEDMQQLITQLRENTNEP